ncbi:MAG: copper transporter, partial [Actinomycetota bacterium]
MITLRHHLLSLIAVFLALGIGVVTGTSFVSPGTITALEGSLRKLGDLNGDLRREVADLRRRNELLGQFATASKEMLIRDVLADQPLVMVSFESTSTKTRDELSQTLLQAGSRVEGSVVLPGTMDFESGDRREQVAAVLEAASPDPDSLRTALVSQLAAALSGREPGTLQRLVDVGLVGMTEAPGGKGKPPSQLVAAGSALVVLAPAQRPRPDSHLGDQFLVPLVRFLVSSSVLVAVAEDGAGPLPTLAPLRGESGLRVI